MSTVSRAEIRELVARALQEMISENAEAHAAISSLSASDQRATTPARYTAPWTGQSYAAQHPSRFEFSVGESTLSPRADEILDFIETKLCSIEKNKSCDHCGLCRSLGF